MEIINNIAYIAYRELVKSDDNPTGVMSESYCKKLIHNGILRKSGRGCYSSPVMIEFDSLPPKYREQWVAIHGDPKKSSEEKTFISRLKPDPKAVEIFTVYRYDGNKKLPEDVIRKYCNDAMIFNTLHEMIEQNRTARNKHGKGQTGIWEWALGVVDSVREFYPNTIPNTAITLRRKYDKYLSEGHYSLIHAGYGNDNKYSFKNPIGEALMMQLCCHGNNLGAPQIAQTYNIWAKGNDEAPVSERTVIKFQHDREIDIMYHRDGKAKFRDKYDRVINRTRPSAPMMLINSDDNDIDLLFISERHVVKKDKTTGEQKVHTIVDKFFRFKIYVVLDVHCNYVLGYAVGDCNSNDLVKRAYRNAMQHVRKMTGSYYLWHQIVADKWSWKEMLPYYQSQATTTLAETGNARSKPIEAFFGTSWHKALKEHLFYCGNNNQAKTKMSPEWIQQHEKYRPMKHEGYAIIARHIETMRKMEWGKSGKTCESVWLENFNKSEVSREREISTETYLSIFGQEHSRPNNVTNKGIEITINGEKIRYDIPKNIYRDVVGRKMQVVYGPEDLSEILVKDDKYQFTTTPYINQPMAIKDMKPVDGVRLNELLQDKKDFIKDIITEDEYRKELLETAGITAQTMLQTGVLIKEISIDANKVYNTQRWGGQPQSDEDDDSNFLTTFHKKSTPKTAIHN